MNPWLINLKWSVASRIFFTFMFFISIGKRSSLSTLMEYPHTKSPVIIKYSLPRDIEHKQELLSLYDNFC